MYSYNVNNLSQLWNMNPAFVSETSRVRASILGFVNIDAIIFYDDEAAQYSIISVNVQKCPD